MSMKIRRFRAHDIEAIERLNQRLQAAGIEDRVYPEDSERSSIDGDKGPISTRLWVASSDNEIHGGVWLKEHDFWVGGQRLRAGWIKYPVAESLINRKFGGVPAAMIFRLMRHQPRLMIVGMGGHNSPIARLLAGMGWKGDTIPFYFYIVRPKRVLRELAYVRTSNVRRFLCDFLALTGLGWVGVKMVTAWRRSFRLKLSPPYAVDYVQHFGPWADAVWERAKESYAFSAVRDCEMLNSQYPVKNQSVMRLRVRRGDEDIGWTCVARLKRLNEPDPYFGPLTLGMIVDSFGRPENARPIMAAATERLIKSGVDLFFANLSHVAWRHALTSLGFLQGPSTYAIYRSPEMVKAFNDSEGLSSTHITRADSEAQETFQDKSRLIDI